LSARSKIEAYFSGITVSPLLFFTPYLPFISDTNTVAVWDYAEKLKMEMSRKNILNFLLRWGRHTLWQALVCVSACGACQCV